MDKPWLRERSIAGMKKTQENSQRDVDTLMKRIFLLKIAEFISTGVLLLVVVVSLIILVVIQYKMAETDYGKAASILSTYTGIILGFVAMAVSLLGMVLSFHNTIQAEESNLEITLRFQDISGNIKRLEELEKSLESTVGSIPGTLQEMNEGMKKIGEIQKGMESMQSKLQTVTEDFRRSLEQSKGSSTEGAQAPQVQPEETPMQTDE